MKDGSGRIQYRTYPYVSTSVNVHASSAAEHSPERCFALRFLKLKSASDSSSTSHKIPTWLPTPLLSPACHSAAQSTSAGLFHTMNGSSLQMIRWCRFLLFIHFTNGWTVLPNHVPYSSDKLWGGKQTLVTASTSRLMATIATDDSVSKVEHKSEVVGATGRMGSFWLYHQEDKKETSRAVAIPRGSASGCSTKEGCPIFVATPRDSWESIWDQTLPNRRTDLVFIGNGIPPEAFHHATLVIPHYAILEVCKPDSDSNPIGTNALSPNTFLYGEYSAYTASVLNQFGVSTEIVESFTDMKIKAATKLVWASCMWLLCHAMETNPITVGTVQKNYPEQLERLVDEIIPALEKFVQRPVKKKEVHEYIKAYNLSIPHAVPSDKLLVDELEERNGIWLPFRTADSPQNFHQELIERIVGKDGLNDLLRIAKSEEKFQHYQTEAELVF